MEQYRVKPAGANSRYDYVPFEKLTRADQQLARESYPHKTEHLPDEAYLYPIKKNGRLADRAARWISEEEAKLLYDAYQRILREERR
jgi:hypothetical protein